jgi:hypothetical protein
VPIPGAATEAELDAKRPEYVTVPVSVGPPDKTTEPAVPVAVVVPDPPYKTPSAFVKLRVAIVVVPVSEGPTDKTTEPAVPVDVVVPVPPDETASAVPNVSDDPDIVFDPEITP